jgi:hypothetical protein
MVASRMGSGTPGDGWAIFGLRRAFGLDICGAGPCTPGSWCGVSVGGVVFARLPRI